ncbi:MAG: VWA domain-containing protein [Candidatus Bathyarchaeia archaeon]
MAGTTELEKVEFAMNPEPRCACVLLLDTSGSMQGEPISALNEGLRILKEELMKDELASKRVEIAIVTFDSDVRVVQDFVTVDKFEPPTLTAQGLTYMGTAILKALDMIEARKSVYKQYGISYYRPWVFMITDGEPQGEPEEIVKLAARRIAEGEEGNHIVFFAVGVEGANMERLKSIVVREPKKLKGLNFRELFLWLSDSLGRVSASKPGEQVPLPSREWEAV